MHAQNVLFLNVLSDLNIDIVCKGWAVLQDVYAGPPLCVGGCLGHRRHSPPPTSLLRNGQFHKQSQHHLDREWALKTHNWHHISLRWFSHFNSGFYIQAKQNFLNVDTSYVKGLCGTLLKGPKLPQLWV